MKYKPYIVFLLIASVALFVILLISFGYYPIAAVNGRLISKRTFLKNYGAAAAYYQNVLKTYQQNSLTEKTASSDDIQRSVLTQLIENGIVEAGARKEAGADLNALVEEKISQASKEPGFDKAVQTLYGMNLDDFKKEILAPQAERDILTGRLFLKGGNIDDWLRDAKKSAKVIIFSPQFRWNGDIVEMR
ncbi:MAG: SurA N-terminal domain-containing protein [Candidatus Liptonbacteria bacterium]|nr:SurA N-terminal domain-containing protein [Candidatus Liptonbacteria bacterium]